MRIRQKTPTLHLIRLDYIDMKYTVCLHYLHTLHIPYFQNMIISLSIILLELKMCSIYINDSPNDSPFAVSHWKMRVHQCWFEYMRSKIKWKIKSLKITKIFSLTQSSESCSSMSRSFKRNSKITLLLPFFILNMLKF